MYVIKRNKQYYKVVLKRRTLHFLQKEKKIDFMYKEMHNSRFGVNLNNAILIQLKKR